MVNVGAHGCIHCLDAFGGDIGKLAGPTICKYSSLFAQSHNDANVEAFSCQNDRARFLGIIHCLDLESGEHFRLWKKPCPSQAHQTCPSPKLGYLDFIEDEQVDVVVELLAEVRDSGREVEDGQHLNGDMN